jgi:hypothetical protein
MQTLVLHRQFVFIMQSGLVTKYKSVLNDGLKMPLGEALRLEKVRDKSCSSEIH